MANIYEKLSAITAEVSAVAKNLKVGEGKNAYKAVSEADVLAAVKPVEAKFGVYSYPLEREILESAVLTNTKTYDGRTYETKQQFIRLRTVYRFVNMESPKEYIDITTYGDGVDPQDKAPGKAMTYADKYALLKAYKIITGDDPDQEKSDELKDKQERPQMATENQIQYIQSLYDKSPENAAYIENACPNPKQLTRSQAADIIEYFENGK